MRGGTLDNCSAGELSRLITERKVLRAFSTSDASPPLSSDPRGTLLA